MLIQYFAGDHDAEEQENREKFSKQIFRMRRELTFQKHSHQSVTAHSQHFRDSQARAVDRLHAKVKLRDEILEHKKEPITSSYGTELSNMTRSELIREAIDNVGVDKDTIDDVSTPHECTHSQRAC